MIRLQDEFHPSNREFNACFQQNHLPMLRREWDFSELKESTQVESGFIPMRLTVFNAPYPFRTADSLEFPELLFSRCRLDKAAELVLRPRFSRTPLERNKATERQNQRRIVLCTEIESGHLSQMTSLELNQRLGSILTHLRR